MRLPTDPPEMCFPNPAGRPLTHLPDGPLQRDLTAETALLTVIGCRAHGRPHARIKDYYWGTVALIPIPMVQQRAAISIRDLTADPPLLA